MTIGEGTNTLVMADARGLAAAFEALRRGDRRGPLPALWDGRAGERIAAAIAAFLSARDRAPAAEGRVGSGRRGVVTFSSEARAGARRRIADGRPEDPVERVVASAIMPPCRTWSSSVSRPPTRTTRPSPASATSGRASIRPALSPRSSPSSSTKYFQRRSLGRPARRRRRLRPRLRQRPLGARVAAARRHAALHRRERRRPGRGPAATCGIGANCQFHHASVDATAASPRARWTSAIRSGCCTTCPTPRRGCAPASRKLKPGAPFAASICITPSTTVPPGSARSGGLSDAMRRGVSRLPEPARYATAGHRRRRLLAAGADGRLWWSAAAVTCRRSRWRSTGIASFYTMRTDALDRFGTRLEQRFTRAEIAADDGRRRPRRIRFSERAPFWCAIGHRRA